MMADYEWSYETPVDEGAGLSAEDWLRATWEGAPVGLRVFLRLAWKYGLGLRLGSTSDPDRVLGWHLESSSSSQATVNAESALLSAENSLIVGPGTVQWRTIVAHKNLVGRLVWMVAKFGHQWLVPGLLRRTIRLRAVTGSPRD